MPGWGRLGERILRAETAAVVAQALATAVQQLGMGVIVGFALETADDHLDVELEHQAGSAAYVALVRGVTHDFIKMGRAIPEARTAQAACAAALRRALHP